MFVEHEGLLVSDLVGFVEVFSCEFSKWAVFICLVYWVIKHCFYFYFGLMSVDGEKEQCNVVFIWDA